MWLKDHCQENLQESKCGGGLYGCRRLRHLLPRPNASITKNNGPCCVVSSCYCSCTNINNNIVFSMNHQQKNEGSSKDEKQMEHIVSSRWNPTPEQLMALEEMYRRGVRTPSAEEIKLIAAKLRQFGKIEGKNVFYWFQNHKARERQKRRRQIESTSNKFGNDDDHNQTLKGNDHKGLSSKELEAEENINRFITNSKEPESMQRAVITERMSQRKMAKSAAKLMADLSCMASSNSDKLYPINTAEQQKTMRLSTLTFTSFYSSNSNQHEDNIATREHQTLELFPLQKNGDHHKNNTDFKEFMIASSMKVPPNHFYEFL